MLPIHTLLTAVCCFLLTLILHSSAEEPAYFNDPLYHAGVYGAFPVHSFFSSDAIAPRVHFSRFFPVCQDGRHWFLESHAPNLPYSVVYILDSDGTFVWSKAVWKTGRAGEQPTISNLQPHVINGSHYLSYWIGIQKGAFGQGEYHLLDDQYNLRYVLAGKNGRMADPHELSITSNSTAIFSIYLQAPADLSQLGLRHGRLWDSGFQEIDIVTGDLLFEWKASDHFTLADMAVNSYARGDYEAGGGLDFFHINSIDKDDEGNYLISSRYASALILIDGITGNVSWILGGIRNEFRDLSSGVATSFFCQHMARWTDDFTTITLFDNGAYWGEKRRRAQALKLHVDVASRTVRVLSSLAHSEGVWSESQGSVQALDDGNVVVGYGFGPKISQFDESGRLVCDIDIAPSSAMFVDPATGFTFNTWAQSYRAFKSEWRARPASHPGARLAVGALWVSWLGDTETHAWSLTIITSDEGRWRRERRLPARRAEKSLFETGISLGTDALIEYMELEALDAANVTIGRWQLDDLGRVKSL